MKYTLKCEQFNYNDFNGNEEDIKTTITHEFRAESLTEMLENFEMFLRGSGFHFDGYLDVVPHEEVVNDSNHYDKELDYDHPEANFDWPEEQTAPMINERDNLSLCPVCKIDSRIMERNDCYDKNCPKIGA